MERTERSFEKNGKERKERNVLLKRTERTECSFEKNGCPTLVQYGTVITNTESDTVLTNTLESCTLR